MRKDFVDCSGSHDHWSASDVEAHFREAILTLKKLPLSMLKGCSSSWPEVLYSVRELAFQEQKPMRLRATPDAISRLEMALEWVTWVDVQERKLIWWRAAKKPWKAICWELGCTRSTAWRKRHTACSKIARILNNLEKSHQKLLNPALKDRHQTQHYSTKQTFLQKK